MENNQRFFLFLALSMAVFFGWFTFGPRWFPDMFPKPPEQADAEKKEKSKSGLAKKTAKKDKGKKAAVKPGAKTRRPAVARRPGSAIKAKAKPKEVVVKPAKKKRPANPSRKIILGADEPDDSGCFMQVVLTTPGASVESIQLNDERYRTVEDRDVPLKVVGNTSSKLRTFATSIPLLDDELKGDAKLNRAHWAVDYVVKKGTVASEVRFSYVTPDESFRVLKRFWLKKVDLSEVSLHTAQDTQASGYELRMELTIENLTADVKTIDYVLQGPVGLPLEDVENARVFKGIVLGLIEDGDVTVSEMTAAKLVDTKTKTSKWDGPFRYIGIDTQYFTALVVPDGDARKLASIKYAEAHVVDEATKPQHSDISLILKSNEFEIAAGEKLSHTYVLYAGPKRKTLLETYEAADVIKFGFFGFFAKIMLAMMNLFHNYLAIPWGIAIVFLTMVVRGVMFPLSKKQARSAQKMKELQPRIAELKKKHANDREKMTRAQMELFRKHGYNPFAGCLPLLLQLPIFFGLYTALSTSIDLRLAAFPLTWIDNLTAPDALFALPFRIPFLGSDFNLLPIITCVLFIVQQKMFMPPAAPDDENAQMTQKMMTFMPIIMGFLFYRVPSGLCIYFITSSLWGIGERKLLDIKGAAPPAEPGEGDADAKTTKTPDSPAEEGKKGGGFFGKLLAMADQAADTRATGNGDSKTEPEKRQSSAQGRGGKKKGGRKGKRSKR